MGTAKIGVILMSRSFRGRPDPQDNPDQSGTGRGPAPQNRGNQSMRPNIRPGQDAGVPARQGRSNSASPDADSEQYEQYEEEQPERQVAMDKRLVAGLIDVVAGYLVNLVVNCIPFVNMFLHDQLVLLMFLLVRDFLFNGRGVGKNLMGLQVIDVRTGAPVSLIQSIKRNITLYGPILLLFVVNQILKFIPDEGIKSIIQNVIVGAGTIYFIIAIPAEIYRVYTRPDGRRYGDEFAGTATVYADMDFSNPMSK